MRYYKIIENNYIKGIGTGHGGNEITEIEYDEIMGVIENKPQSDVYGYKLKIDKTWEEYELPPKEEIDKLSEIEQKAQAYDILTGGAE